MPWPELTVTEPKSTGVLRRFVSIACRTWFDRWRSVPGPNPSTAIGSLIVTSTVPPRKRHAPAGRTCRLPLMVTGTIGRFDWAASKNPPFLNRSSFPSRLRVPSGKTTIEIPAAIRSFARFKLLIAARGSPRSIVICRDAHIAQPKNGIQRSSLLAIQRN
jgi:hypothetical protein